MIYCFLTEAKRRCPVVWCHYESPPFLCPFRQLENFQTSRAALPETCGERGRLFGCPPRKRVSPRKPGPPRELRRAANRGATRRMFTAVGHAGPAIGVPRDRNLRGHSALPPHHLAAVGL